MNLEVGMYVRTKWGIAKVTSTYEENIYVDRCFQPIDETMCFKEDIIGEPSHNTIDLIEAGDYVNGFPVIHKENDILKCGLLVQFKENEIKSIVTKEQFESMIYKVGEK